MPDFSALTLVNEETGTQETEEKNTWWKMVKKYKKGLYGCQITVADQINCETKDRMGQSFSQTMTLPVNVD